VDVIRLNQLPDLPQQKTISDVAKALWRRPEVIALWLGGSLARGTGDVFSDIDLRMAVVPAHLPDWEVPSFERLLVYSPVVGQQLLRFGDDTFLHHLLLSSGELLDLFIQSAEGEVTAEPFQVLGCRDTVFAGKLAHTRTLQAVIEHHPPIGEQLRAILVDFWINSHKHRTLLYRGLGALCIRRIQKERDLLLRLWYIAATGQDYGNVRESVHSLTEIVSSALDSGGVLEPLVILGAPTRNQLELIQVIELNRRLVSELGHQFAEQYGFEYPGALEATVVTQWQYFVGSTG
jgi:hypothetical protein